jgi:hypothetical protein
MTNPPGISSGSPIASSFPFDLPLHLFIIPLFICSASADFRTPWLPPRKSFKDDLNFRQTV